MAETTRTNGQTVQAPESGQTVVVNAIPGQDILLAAAFDQAEIKMEGGNVVFAFANGGQVVLDFTDLDAAQAPNVVMADGSVLDMQEYLAALGEGDVEPAAGPDAGATDSGGVGEYQDDAGSLVDGVDKLGGLDPREFTSIVVESLDADPVEDAPGDPVVPTNDVPIALPDLDTVNPEGVALGNVMTGLDTTDGLNGPGTDIPGNDTPVTVTKVVGFEGDEDTEFNESGNLSVNGQYGNLTIKADGSYEYSVFGEALELDKVTEFKPILTAFKFQESFFDADGRFSADEASGAVATGGAGGAYFGVAGTEGQNVSVPPQINYSDSYSEALAFNFGGSVISAEIGVSNMFKNENGGEAMRWHAFDADGVRIGTGVVSANPGVEGVDTPYEQTTLIDWNGSSNVGTFEISGIGSFNTLVFEAVPYSKDGFTASDNSDFFVKVNSYHAIPEGEIQDVFTYTITDANGDSSEATLTISDLYGNGELVNDAPVAADNNYGWDDLEPFLQSSIEGESSPVFRSMGIIRGNVITDDDDGGGAATGRDWDQDTPILNLMIKSVNGEDLDFTSGPVEVTLDNGGTLHIEDNGYFEYQPAGEQGDSFTYTIVDVHGAESDMATVNLLMSLQQADV